MQRAAIHVLILLGLGGSQLFAQNPGQRISVDIRIDSITVRGDTIGVASVVTNGSTSQESLWSYLVDEPSGVITIRRPTSAPGTKWYPSRDFRARPMAVWDVLGNQLAPNAASPQLYFESIGVPAIVQYWAGGKFQLSTNEDATDSALVNDPLTTEMITGSTVGVSPWPVDRTPAGLLARLRTLTQSTCNAPLQWLTDSSLCTQLLSDIDQADAYRSAGQTAEAKSTLTHYSGLLGSPNSYAPGVTSSAYWLLKVNADIINAML